MSASGATIQRQGIHVPIWPILALLVLTVATGVTLRVMDDVRQAQPATTVQGADLTWDSTVGHPQSPRQGVRPTMIGVIGLSAFEASSAAVRELPAAPFHSEGRAHEVLLGNDTPTAPVEIPDFRACLRCGGRR